MTLGYHLPGHQGDSWWFLDTTMTVMAGRDETNGAFTLIEFAAPDGFAPPMHVHEDEDEAFYVLEGQADVVCGDEHWRAAAGSFVFLPRGVAHSFLVGEGGLTALQLTTPAGFESFVEALGRQPDRPGLPDPAEPDVTRLVEVSGRHGYRILGPPPPAQSRTAVAAGEADPPGCWFDAANRSPVCLRPAAVGGEARGTHWSAAP